MENEVAKQPETVLANPSDFGNWGAENDLDTSDIIIPKILLMQTDSKLVEEEKAKNKDFVNSSTKEVMTDIIFTPFDMKKVYKISKKVGNSTEFVREEAWTKENDNRDKEWQENEETLLSQKIWRFYGLVENEGIPYVLDLKGMSFSTGKRLANQMFVANKVKKLLPAGYKVKLGTEKQDYEGAVKNVFTYSLHKVTSNEELKEAFSWYEILRTKDMILDTAGDTFEDSVHEAIEKAHVQDVDTNDNVETKKEVKEKIPTDKNDLPW